MRLGLRIDHRIVVALSPRIYCLVLQLSHILMCVLNLQWDWIAGDRGDRREYCLRLIVRYLHEIADVIRLTLMHGRNFSK